MGNGTTRVNGRGGTGTLAAGLLPLPAGEWLRDGGAGVLGTGDLDGEWRLTGKANGRDDTNAALFAGAKAGVADVAGPDESVAAPKAAGDDSRSGGSGGGDGDGDPWGDQTGSSMLPLAPRTLVGATVDRTGGGNAPVGLDARLGLLKALLLPETTLPVVSPTNEGAPTEGVDSRGGLRPQ